MSSFAAALENFNPNGLEEEADQEGKYPGEQRTLQVTPRPAPRPLAWRGLR